jgi:hypothetical protein
MRREAGYPLSAPLLAGLGAVARRGGKAILLLNRRGVVPALHCRGCGETIRCRDCDVSLVLHGDASLRCHHCGYSERAREVCPSCGSPELVRLGAGTQKLERELETHVPELERVRLDADTAGSPASVAAALRRFADADRAVLARPDVQRVTGEMLREACRRGVWGWVDDDLAFVRPWGFALAAIRVPVSIWQGAHDHMVPFAHGEWLAQHVPGATVHLYDDEGHLSLAQQMPRIVADLSGS